MQVTWLGLRAREDWVLVRRAVADGYALVIALLPDRTVRFDLYPSAPA